MNKDDLDKELKIYFDNYPKILNSRNRYFMLLLYFFHLIVTFWQPYIVITFLIGYKKHSQRHLPVLLLHLACISLQCLIPF